MAQENSKKKILLVTRPICPPWDEASKNFTYYLAKNISDFEFGLLTNGILPELPENIHQKAIYTSNSFSYLQKIRLIKNLRKFKNDFDILHFLFTPTKQNTFLIKHFVGYKNHGRSIQTIATLREDLYSAAEIKKLIFGDLVITYSDYAKNKLNDLGFKNVKRVYPGIDIELYSPADKSLSLLKQYNIEPDDFVVTFPGEFTRLGAMDDIINMALQYSKILKGKKIKIILACRVKNKEDFEKKEKIREILKKNDLSDYILLPDTFETMEKVFNSSDVLIFPVRNMQGKFDVPLAVIEAMACAKPVIISNLPILNEFAKENIAVRIEPGNPEKLWDSIMDLYNSPEKRNQIGSEARKFVADNFDIKQIAEIYKKIYEVL